MRSALVRIALGLMLSLALTAQVQAQATKSTTTTTTTKKAAAKVDLNTATVSELEELPGIGPARAAEIVKARPFKTVNELKALKGISAATYAELAPHVTVGETITKTTTTKEAMPKTATKTATKKAAAAEAAHEEDPQHLTKKKDALAAGRKININTATAEELQELPGIGPVRSAAIIKERPFESVEDIMKVEGIKQGIFGHIKDHISVAK